MPITSDILRTYRAPREVVRGLRAVDRSEGRLLFYLVLACGLIFVAQWPRLARQAQLDSSVPFEGMMTGALFGLMFLFPLIAYGVSALLGLVMRIGVRGIDGYDVRLALFWALLASSPLMLLHGLVQGIIGPGAQANLVGVVVFAAFLAILVAGLRVARDAGKGLKT